MKIMILGASGMLGQALVAECTKRRHQVNANRIEITNDLDLVLHIARRNPDIVINSAALCNLNACEDNPDLAYRVNARPALLIAKELPGTRFVQISSDQAANPLNEYAHSKAAAERYAERHLTPLIVRTNIVGLKNTAWAFEAIENDLPITLFDDYHTASIDIWNFSAILLDVLEQHPEQTGILNIASRDTVTKKEFIETLAASMGKELTKAEVGSIKGISPKRPSYSGLDVSRVEKLLNRRMPGLDDVIEALVERRIQCTAQSQLANR